MASSTMAKDDIKPSEYIRNYMFRQLKATTLESKWKYATFQGWNLKFYQTEQDAIKGARYSAGPWENPVYVLKRKPATLLYIVNYEDDKRILRDANGKNAKVINQDGSFSRYVKKSPAKYYVQARGYSEGPFNSLPDAKKAAKKLSGDSMWDYEYGLDYVTVGIYKDKTHIGSVYASKYTPAKSK